MFRLSAHHKRLTHLQEGEKRLRPSLAQHPLLRVTPAPPLPLPPSSDDIRTDLKHSLLSLMSQRWVLRPWVKMQGSPVFTSGMHSSSHAVLRCSRTVMWGEESTAYLELNPPSLSSALLLSLLLSMSLLSLVSFHFIPSSRPRLAPSPSH